MLDKNRRPWKWDSKRSELQVIGSYTRSCRILSDAMMVDRFWAVLGGESISARADLSLLRWQ